MSANFQVIFNFNTLIFLILGPQLKSEWTSLRNAFNKYKREAKPKTGDEGGTGYDDIGWKFWKPMADFLLSVNKFDGAEYVFCLLICFKFSLLVIA